MKAQINGISKGDRFNYKKGIYEVVAVCHVIDSENGEILGRKCYARGVNTLATNTFEIPFSTVKLNLISK